MKVLRNLFISATVITAGLVGVNQLFAQAPAPIVKAPAPARVVPVTPLVDLSPDELLTKTNEQRAAAGLKILYVSGSLINSATAKCNDMEVRNYWSHNTPDGKEPWTFFTPGWHYMGENLAKGFYTNTDTMNAWMLSPTHKANILNPNYTSVGFAICDGQVPHLIVQHFGG